MMLLDSWNPVFRVKFADNKDLNEDFDSKDEAVSYAISHLEFKPIVEGLEVYIDDMGTITEEAEAEEIYSYLTEAKKEEKPKVKLDRLDELEAELQADDDAIGETTSEIPADPGTSTEGEAEPVAALLPEEEPAAADDEIDPYGFASGMNVDTNAEVFDPFAQDFDDISKDEEECANCVSGSLDPVEFFTDLAKQLGVEDQVMIAPASDVEYPEYKPSETIDPGFWDVPETVYQTEEPTPVENEFDVFDVDEPVTVIVAADVPADAVDQISSENATVTVPTDAAGIEAPAETVATCTTDPVTGEEICTTEESLEGTVPQDLTDDRTPVQVDEPEIKDEPVDYKAEVAKEKCLAEEELEEHIQDRPEPIEDETEYSGVDNQVVPCKADLIIAHCEDEKPVDCLGEEEPLEKPLTEAAPEDPDPEEPAESNTIEDALDQFAAEFLEESTDDDMSDQELAEKLWEARCKKLEEKAEN